MRLLILLVSLLVPTLLAGTSQAQQSPPPAAQTATVTTLLGRAARSQDGKETGRIVDVVVTTSGQPVAALVDFGGFMGVGIRRIAVEWSRLRFAPGLDAAVHVDLTTEQIKTAPDYKDSAPSGQVASDAPQPAPAAAR